MNNNPECSKAAIGTPNPSAGGSIPSGVASVISIMRDAIVEVMIVNEYREWGD